MRSDLVKITDAARRMGKYPRYVRTQIAAGTLEPVELDGKRYVTAGSLARLIASRPAKSEAVALAGVELALCAQMGAN
jgi:hypothetical protein